MKALILAAGYATRLYPLTKDTPKPLLKLKNRAVLDYIVDRIERVGDISQVYIVTNDKFHSQFEDWLAGRAKDLRCRYKLVNDGSTDPDERRGACGDLKLVIEQEQVNDDLLVVAGDNLFDFDLASFVAFAASKRPAHSICLYLPHDENTDLTQYGIAQLAGDGLIIDFEEKPHFPKSNLVSTCVYFIPREKVSRILNYAALGNTMDAPGNYISWLIEHDQVYGKIYDGIWFDLGDFDSLSRAVMSINGHSHHSTKL